MSKALYHQIFRNDLAPRLTASAAVRLLTAWEKLRSEGRTVFLSEFGPDHLHFARDYMIVLRKQDDGSYFYDYFGEGVSDVFGADMSGHSTRMLTSAVGDLLEKTYDEVIETGQPLLLVHRANNAINAPLWERFIVPVVAASGAKCVVAHARPRETDQDLLAALLDASPEGIAAFQAVRALDGQIVDAIFTRVNRRAAELSEQAAEDVLGRSLLTLFPGIVPAQIWTRYLRVMNDRKVERFEVNLALREGSRWLRIAAAPLGDGFMISYNDITEFKRLLDDANKIRQDLAVEIEARQLLEGELRRMATTDGLTGILNRRGFEDAAKRAARSARDRGEPLSAISFDLDHFKTINDRFGHAAGDAVLMSVASSVADLLERDTESFARVGGEEFVVLLPGAPIETAAATAETLRSIIASTPIFTDAGLLNVSASFGVHGSDKETPLEVDALLAGADQALYHSKRGGRNQVTVFETGLA